MNIVTISYFQFSAQRLEAQFSRCHGWNGNVLKKFMINAYYVCVYIAFGISIIIWCYNIFLLLYFFLLILNWSKIEHFHIILCEEIIFTLPKGKNNWLRYEVITKNQRIYCEWFNGGWDLHRLCVTLFTNNTNKAIVKFFSIF